MPWQHSKANLFWYINCAKLAHFNVLVKIDQHLHPMFVKHIVFKPFLTKGDHCIYNVFDGVPKFNELYIR